MRVSSLFSHAPTREAEAQAGAETQLMLAGLAEHRAARASYGMPVALLPEGADPAAGVVADWIRLDPSLVPEAHRDAPLFAYRLSDAGAAHARDALAGGDVAVFSRKCWPPEPGEVYAVRAHGRVLLSRVAVKDRSLVVLSTEPKLGVELLPLDDQSKSPSHVLGRLILVARPRG